MQRYLDKIKDSNFAKALLLLILTLVSFKTYIWVDTESTDNAYVSSDITTISGEVNGRIVESFYKDNIFVNEGDVILQIDDQDYKSNFSKASASLEIAKNELQILEQKIEITKLQIDKEKDSLSFANVNYDKALADYNRTIQLTKDNFSSKQNLDNSYTLFEKAKMDLSAAKFALISAEQNLSIMNLQYETSKLNLEVAQNNFDISKKALENTKIKAPISGFLANSYIEVGNFVRTGVPLFQIVPNDKIYIQANFKETQASKLSAGSEVKIFFDALPKYEIKGIVRNISPATGSTFSLIPADNATGNFTKIVQRIPVYIDFTLPEEIKDKVKTGMSATVYIRRS